MIRKATLMIAEAFDKRDIKYTIQEIGDETSVVDAGFGIACGPSAHILFASSDEENDVAIRITGLMQNIPSDKRPAMNEACNTINDKMRYLKSIYHETHEGKENTALKLLNAIQELKKNPVLTQEEKNDH